MHRLVHSFLHSLYSYIMLERNESVIEVGLEVRLISHLFLVPLLIHFMALGKSYSLLRSLLSPKNQGLD